MLSFWMSEYQISQFTQQLGIVLVEVQIYNSAIQGFDAKQRFYTRLEVVRR